MIANCYLIDTLFPLQAGIAAHYLGGAYYPVGGPQRISRALIPTIEAAGGRVLVKASVSRILIEEDSGRAVGVALREGSEVRVRPGGSVVSGAGAVVTQQLVPEKYADALGYRRMIEQATWGSASVIDYGMRRMIAVHYGQAKGEAELRSFVGSGSLFNLARTGSSLVST